MEKDKRYYVTTPIYYPNGRFHIGTAFTTLLADTIKKYRQQRGYETYLSTGVDEHGQKIADTATDEGKSPQEFTDEKAEAAIKLWEELQVDYDFFVRTTDKKHKEQVQKIFKYFQEKGDIYKGKYVGNYCKPDESYFTDTQLIDGKCPACGREVTLMEEETYFFNMNKYVDKLLKYYEEHPKFILPENRKNEIVNTFIKPGLEDLSVTRTSFDWGVKVPGDEKHVIYVWLDALTNYITLLGYDVDVDSKKIVKVDEERPFDKFWPANVHIVGKDIIRFHGLYWPIFLMALDIPLPETIYSHDWFVMKDGKMSKSKGNVIYPDTLKDIIGLDPLRYILLREMPYVHDGVLSPDGIISKYNTELNNDLSNLIHRVKGMVSKYELQHESLNIDRSKLEEKDIELEKEVLAHLREFEEKFEGFMIQKAIEEIGQIISKTNKYIDVTEPWTLYKNGEKEKLDIFIYVMLNMINIISTVIYPVLPITSVKIAESYNLEKDEKLKYENLRKGIEKGELLDKVTVMPNYEYPAIYSRLTEDKEQDIKNLFN